MKEWGFPYARIVARFCKNKLRKQELMGEKL